MVVEVVVEEVTMIDFLSNDGNNCELVRMVAVEEVVTATLLSVREEKAVMMIEDEMHR